MKKLGLFLLIAFVVALVLFARSQHNARVEAERQLGLDAARMVSATFTKAAEVKVGTLEGKVTARGEHDGTVFNPTQTSTIPVTVDYFIDLRGVSKRSYRWDGENKLLIVDIPDVKPSKPNLDETAAITRQEGVIIFRKAGREMAKQVSERATARATVEAQEPHNLNQARANAREVIARLAREPLAAAGLRDVQVAARFPWEPKNSASSLAERWDESRRMEDVLRERQRGAETN